MQIATMQAATPVCRSSGRAASAVTVGVMSGRTKSSLAQLEEDLAAVDLELTVDQRPRLDAVH